MLWASVDFFFMNVCALLSGVLIVRIETSSFPIIPLICKEWFPFQFLWQLVENLFYLILGWLLQLVSWWPFACKVFFPTLYCEIVPVFLLRWVSCMQQNPGIYVNIQTISLCPFIGELLRELKVSYKIVIFFPDIFAVRDKVMLVCPTSLLCVARGLVSWFC